MYILRSVKTPIKKSLKIQFYKPRGGGILSTMEQTQDAARHGFSFSGVTQRVTLYLAQTNQNRKRYIFFLFFFFRQ